MSDQQQRYYLRHKLIGEKEVTVEQFMEAERQAGFYSKFPGKPATGGFGFGDINGSVRYAEAHTANEVAVDPGRNVALAQRLREYLCNPHHINPPSDACKQLIEDIAEALTKAPLPLTDELLTAAYWDFDARRKGYAPYHVPAGQECGAFKVSINAAIDAAAIAVPVQELKLPERLDESQCRGTSLIAARRWNACLDEVAQLNAQHEK